MAKKKKTTKKKKTGSKKKKRAQSFSKAARIAQAALQESPPKSGRFLFIYGDLRWIKIYCKIYKLYRGIEQLAARQAHNLEVPGSSPGPATTG